MNKGWAGQTSEAGTVRTNLESAAFLALLNADLRLCVKIWLTVCGVAEWSTSQVATASVSVAANKQPEARIRSISPTDQAAQELSYDDDEPRQNDYPPPERSGRPQRS